jgi:hypothetical protein
MHVTPVSFLLQTSDWRDWVNRHVVVAAAGVIFEGIQSAFLQTKHVFMEQLQS